MPNDFLPIGTAGGANVETQAAYLADAIRGTFYADGAIPDAKVHGKMFRQASVITSLFAQMVSDYSGLNMLDNGDLVTLLTTIKTQFRIRLIGDINLYVSVAGGNNANNGLTPGTAWATPAYAYAFIRDNYDLNSHNIVVNLVDGAYGAVSVSGRLTGASTVSAVTMKAASAAVTYTTLTGHNGAWITVDGGTISGSPFGLLVDDFAWIGYKNCTFGAASTHHMNASLNGRITCLGNYTITGGSGAHFATNMGIIDASAANVTVTGTPNFPNAFAFTSGGVIYSTDSLVFAGAATGARYSSTVNGIIQTNGGGSSYFPGNASGIILTGGQYA